MQIFIFIGEKFYIMWFCFLYIKIKVLFFLGEIVVLFEGNEFGGVVFGTIVLNGKAVGQLFKVFIGRGGGWWLQNGI